MTAIQPAAAQKNLERKQEIRGEIERALLCLHPDPADVFEVRALGIPGRGKPHTAAGYFDREHLGAAAMEAYRASYDLKAKGVYVTLNPVNPALLARAPNTLTEYLENTTTDAEILTRNWLFVDIDPHRPTGIAATDGEKQAAVELGEVVVEALRRYGFPYPVFGDSGNGQYLLYRVDLPNDEASTKLVREFYAGLKAILPSNNAEPYAEIDTSVCNAARIARPGGLVNRKGQHTVDRPHRQTHIYDPAEGETIEVVPRERIEAVAALASQQGPNGKARSRNGQEATQQPQAGRIDVPLYCSDYGVKIRDTKQEVGRTIFILEACPFDSNHGQSGEVSIVQATGGLTTFHCKHNTCQGHTWQDFKARVGKLEARHLGKPEGPAKASTTAPEYPPIAVGAIVYAGDRGNFGDVVADLGDSCSVHFQNPDTGAERTKTLPKSQLRTGDGKALAPPEESVDYPLMTCAELMASDVRVTYLVDGMVPEAQPVIVAGPKKSLKTSLLLALALYLATAMRFLREFSINRAVPVCIMTGESGLATVKETILRIALNMGIDPAKIDNLFITESLPRFGSPAHVEAVQAMVETRKIKALIVDPAYMCIDGADAGNLFIQGAQLREISEACRKNGCSLILAHHTRKNLAQPYGIPELEDIAWAGFQEFARAWILVNRRERYIPGTGSHRLWLSCGGSAGHGSLHGLNIDEGQPPQRTWEAQIVPYDELKQSTKDERQKNRDEAQQQQLDHDRKIVVQAMVKYPGGETKTTIRDGTGLGGTRFTRALASLLDDATAVLTTVQKGGRNAPRDAYKLQQEAVES